MIPAATIPKKVKRSLKRMTDLSITPSGKDNPAMAIMNAKACIPDRYMVEREVVKGQKSKCQQKDFCLFLHPEFPSAEANGFRILRFMISQ